MASCIYSESFHGKSRFFACCLIGGFRIAINTATAALLKKEEKKLIFIAFAGRIVFYCNNCSRY